MANLTEDELARMIDDAVRDETERCALLCEMRADISRASATKFRKEGSYTTRAIWPPFKRMTYVMPRWERLAKIFDDVAHAFDAMASGIRAGWDPRKLTREPKEKIKPDEPWTPCPLCTSPLDCGSWCSCEKGFVGEGGRH